MTKPAIPTNQGYAAEAPVLLKRYEARSSDEGHAEWLHLFPARPCKALDIGAGTGRDAAWLAQQGCKVLAVEPTAELREGAQALHPEPSIRWLDDALPQLNQIGSLNETFDLVLLIAVWMHLDRDQRAEAMPHIAALMHPGARVFMMLRHGPVPIGRRMFDVGAEETIELAHAQGLVCLYNEHAASLQSENRSRDITWTKLVFELPR
jgi:SAM-dependent methyltransferase